MKVLEITGGVGSGKSHVLTFLKEEYRAHVCQMDEVARRLQQKGSVCYRDIVDHFGTDILEADGQIDRARLGAVVFSDGGKLELLNRIVHPAVLEQVRRDIAQKGAEGIKLYVLEAALLPDVGGELCDELWYVYADEEARRSRLKASRGYTDEKITQMIKRQPTEERFRRACTAVIDNSGPFEDTMRQIGDKLRL